MNSTIRTLILITLVGVGAFAGSTAASSHASISASPATPGETATHTATVTVGAESTGPLNGFTLDYRDAAVDASDVSAENVMIGVDRGGDNDGAQVDENITDDLESVQTSNDGMRLNLSLGGSTNLSEGDEVVVQVENVLNPEAGEYTVPLNVNPESSGGEAEAMLSISDSGNGASTASETTTDTETTDEATTDTETTDETETRIVSVSDDDTVTEGPGFGVVVAVLAVLGAALVVARRQQ